MSRQEFMVTKKRFPVYADACITDTVIDVHKEVRANNIDKKRIVITASVAQADVGTSKLDINNWLPFAAREYNISPDIMDYFFIPVITIPSDLANRNTVSFPLREMLKFHPDMGMQAYKTFKAKPVQYEHDNQDITKAYGVIADVFLRPMKGFSNGKVWKMINFLAIDRTKDPEKARRVLEGELNSYSMGAMVGYYTCSFCGQELGKCRHLDKKKKYDFYEKDGHLIHRECCDFVGFEESMVEDPAFTPAVSDIIYT